MRTRHPGLSGIALAVIVFIVAAVPLFSQGAEPREATTARDKAVATLKARNAAVEEHPKTDKGPAWTSVDLGFTQVTDEGIAPLKDIPDLRKLYLYSGRMTSKGLSSIKDLGNLEVLYLDGCRAVDDKGLESLAGLTSLKTLSLDSCSSVSDKGLAHLKQLSALEDLNLTGTNISDEGLKQLSDLHKLKSLTLDGAINRRSTITDAGLKFLEPLNQLERLSLLDAKITDASVASLAKLPQLKQLNLQHCSKVSSDAIKKLQKALPDCTIER